LSWSILRLHQFTPNLGLDLIGTMFTTIGISTLFLDYIHDGWYTYYIFRLPRQHSPLGSMFVYFWMEDLMRPLYVASVISAFYIVVEFWKGNKKGALFYLTLAISMVGASLAGRLNPGGYNNVLFPAYATISILFGLGMHKAFDFIERASKGPKPLMRICFYLVCIIQFAALVYDPFSQIPTREDLEAGEQLVNTIQEIEGDVYIPFHTYLPVLTGKKGFAHQTAIAELQAIFGGTEQEAGTKLFDELRQAIRDKRFGAIILDSEWLQNEIEGYYVKDRPVFDSKTVFWPVTGKRTRPEFIYVPKR